MKTDVLIVCAGPAGSTAAKFLAERDIKVVLIDKDKYKILLTYYLFFKLQTIHSIRTISTHFRLNYLSNQQLG